MRSGEVVRVKHLLVIEPFGYLHFKAPKGQRSVLLVLGIKDEGGVQVAPVM
jgi:hypothetical protein